jgi:hypothetical protein
MRTASFTWRTHRRSKPPDTLHRMRAVDLVRSRVSAAGGSVQDLIGQTRDLDWATPLLPGTSPIGLTLWHLPRTLDWLVQTSIRGETEVADGASYGDLPDTDRFGFGTGLSADEAATAAALVRPDALLAYNDAVLRTVDQWLATLGDDDLDKPVDGFDDRQRTRPSYVKPEAVAAIEGLGQLSLGLLLQRPSMTHLFRHLGEVDLIAQLARS